MKLTKLCFLLILIIAMASIASAAVTIYSPENKTYFNVTSVFLNYTASDVFCDYSLNDSANVSLNTGDISLVKNTTVGAADREIFQGVATGSNGDVYAAGSTNSTGNGGNDVWVVKFNRYGIKLWEKTYGGSGDDNAADIALDSSDNIYLTGNSYSFSANRDIWTLKLDSDGNHVWNESFILYHDDSGGTIGTYGDRVYVGGQTRSIGSSSYTQQLLILYNATTGTKIWDKSYGGAGNDNAKGLAIDDSGNLYVSGDTSSYPFGQWRIWTAKYDPDGVNIWNSSVGGGGIDNRGRDIALDSSGNVISVGTNKLGNRDFYTLKYNSAGALLWGKVLGNTGDEISYGVETDSDDNIYVTGDTSSYGAGGKDVLLVKYNSSGSLIWNKTAGGASDDFGYAIAPGSLNVVGWTASYGAGERDGWLLKYSGACENADIPVSINDSYLLSVYSADVLGTVEEADAIFSIGELHSITEPVWPAGYDLYDTDGNLIVSPTNVTTVQIRKDGTQIMAEFDITGDVDLSGITIDSTASEVAVDSLYGAPGVVGTHALFVSAANVNGAYGCPDASIISEVIPSCIGVVSFTDTECVDITTTSGLTCSVSGSYYKIAGFTSSGAEANGPALLPGQIPEFSTIGIILAIVIAGLGIGFVVKRRK